MVKVPDFGECPPPLEIPGSNPGVVDIKVNSMSFLNSLNKC
ncbi:hypothetical protein OnM2_044090 [Erysiphe neolycopersici]|uniref:Uncharacterized protein n=1 Tax=Erysiphe neolycopersici TaxID=212602 RepID=A0A420HUQ7_9PEZI|nr:hypothetical protein OnM2_044090 [Erysiphe neolycopersici]